MPVRTSDSPNAAGSIVQPRTRCDSDDHAVVPSDGGAATRDAAAGNDAGNGAPGGGVGPDVPTGLASALCPTGALDGGALRTRVKSAGFAVCDVTDHRPDLLAMRDRLAGRVDYAGLLSGIGTRGEAALAAFERVEDAVEDGRNGYVSLVAGVDG